MHWPFWLVRRFKEKETCWYGLYSIFTLSISYWIPTPYFLFMFTTQDLIGLVCRENLENMFCFGADINKIGMFSIFFLIFIDKIKLSMFSIFDCKIKLRYIIWKSAWNKNRWEKNVIKSKQTKRVKDVQ